MFSTISVTAFLRSLSHASSTAPPGAVSHIAVNVAITHGAITQNAQAAPPATHSQA